MTSSYTYSYYLLRFTPQRFSNPLSSFRGSLVVQVESGGGFEPSLLGSFAFINYDAHKIAI